MRALVKSFDLDRRSESNLIDDLEDINRELRKNHTGSACMRLAAFPRDSRARSGHRLTADQAAQLAAAALDVKALISCSG